MRILEVCIDLDGGGVDRYLYNYCTKIDDEIKFDFVVTDNLRGCLEPLLEERGARIFRVPRIKNGIARNFRAMRHIMMSQHYDAVHVHLGYKSFIALWSAILCGIKTRVTHAHIAFVPETIKEVLIRKLCTGLTKLFSTELVACGIDAAEWVWGKKAYSLGKVKVLNNAIDTKSFMYDAMRRNEYRKELGIDARTLVVGHVGRLSDQKNQLRLLEIFHTILTRTENALLLLIGQGEMEREVRQKVEELGIHDKVMLLGIRNDVAALLNAMDVFVFPSKYEGLPFTLIETQSNGLPSISSDSVTRHVKVSNCLSFMSLDDTDDAWADAAIRLANAGRVITANTQVAENGYDIYVEAEKLKEFYCACIEQHK